MFSIMMQENKMWIFQNCNDKCEFHIYELKKYRLRPLGIKKTQLCKPHP